MILSSPRNLGGILDFSTCISQIQSVMKSYQLYMLKEHFPRRGRGVIEDDKKGARIAHEGEDQPDGRRVGLKNTENCPVDVTQTIHCM